jgi:hypothetical protein
MFSGAAAIETAAAKLVGKVEVARLPGSASVDNAA